MRVSSVLADKDKSRENAAADWLHANGQVADEIRAHDWSKTSLGPRESWPHTLRTTLNLILNSGLSTFVGWGEDLLCFYNDAYTPMLEGKEDTLGRPLRVVFPESLERVGSLFEDAMRGRATYSDCLLVPIIRSGELQDTWWVLSYSPIYDEVSQICGVFVPLHEITARLQAEAKLQASEESLRIFSDLVPSFLWRSRTDASIIWSNQRMQDYLGGADPIEAVHPDERSSLIEEWERARRDGTTFHHCHRMQSADGEYRWFLSVSEPRLQPDGSIEEWCGAATDIHDLHAAAETLADNSSLFRSFANNSADVLWIADVESKRLDYLSAAFHAIWGPTPADCEINWDYWVSTIHPDDRQHQAESFERLIRGEVLNEHYRIVRRDGTVRWIRDTMFPIIGVDGSILKIAGIAQDITRQNGKLVHLIDAGPESRNVLVRQLQTLGYQVRPFGTVTAFLRVSRALLPGCVVMVDNEGGVEAAKLASSIKREVKSLPLVLVCDVPDVENAISLMKQGVCDIVRPADPSDRLEQALAAAMAEMQTDEGKNRAVASAHERMHSLSEREREILHGLSEGATNKLLARDLGLSPRTVETYRMRILEKLGVTSLPEAVKIATLADLGGSASQRS